MQEAWREAAASVDIRGALRGSDPMHREQLIKTELQKYDGPVATARESVAEQARIIQDDLVASHSHECVGQPGEVDLALVEA